MTSFTLSVYLNYLFADGAVVPDERVLRDGVARAARCGVEAVDLRPWDHPARDAVVAAVESEGMDVAYLSGRDEFAPLTDAARRADAVDELTEGIEVAAEIGCATLNVKTGRRRHDVDQAVQFDHVVTVLRSLAPVAADTGVTLVLEPVNSRTESPPQLVRTVADAARVVTAVDHPSVRLLFDVYHEQVMAGDVVRSIREHADAIGHVHVADVPGRHEPGTGELNYANVFDALADVGYGGYVGLEFYPTGEPAAAIEDVRSMT